MISEYEIGKHGWLMRLAFFSWAACTLSFVVRLVLVSRTDHIVVYVWFSLIVLSLVGAGIFKTDPITEVSRSFTNVMHSVCGTIVILTFPVAATIGYIGYARESQLRGIVREDTAARRRFQVSEHYGPGAARQR